MTKKSPRPTVLLVEDEPELAEHIAAMLRELGYEVAEPLSTFEQAKAAIRQGCADAALLDLKLGGEETYPLARSLSSAGVPFAFITANPDAIVSPFNDEMILTKPFSMLDLDDALGAMLDEELQKSG